MKNFNPYYHLNFIFLLSAFLFAAESLPGQNGITDRMLGEVILFAGNKNEIPRGWLTCDGRTLPVEELPDLFEILGTTYGGNGISNFDIPKMKAPNSALSYIICISGIYPERDGPMQAQNEPYISEVTLFAGGFVPVGWIECNGQKLDVQKYQVLFSLLGNTYGGNGKTNFEVPKLKAPDGMRYIIAKEGIFPSAN